MKRLIGTVKRTSSPRRPTLGGHQNSSLATDSPEAKAVKEVCAFCEKGEIDRPGDEFLHLPAIVEAAESTPAAAHAAARQIHKYLSKPNSTKGVRQYNSLMLIRILADNPGQAFTRNFDSRFVSSIKDLLRDGRDMNVQQILRETLEHLANNKSADENLGPLLEMWRKEKEKFEKNYNLSPLPNPTQPTHDYFVHNQRQRGLPATQELASRISEANSSAKLLRQMVESTPLSEFQQNDLLKEFASRCQSASKSIQSYIDTTDPAPDEDTMFTLIETNDKLSVALSKYRRAALAARKEYPPPEPAEQPPQQQQTSSPQPEAESKPSPKNRLTTRFASLRRKPTRSGREESQQSAQPARTAQAPAPIGGPETNTRSTAAQPVNTISGDGAPVSQSGPTLFPHPPASTTTNDRSAPAPTGGYHYNSDDFQIENPFADRFSTNNNTNGDTGHPTTNPATSTAPPMANLNSTATGGGQPPSGMQPSNNPAVSTNAPQGRYL